MVAWLRRIVGYALDRRIDARLTLAALKAAFESRHPPIGCVHHSDRGLRYQALRVRSLQASGLCEAVHPPRDAMSTIIEPPEEANTSSHRC